MLLRLRVFCAQRRRPAARIILQTPDRSGTRSSEAAQPFYAETFAKRYARVILMTEAQGFGSRRLREHVPSHECIFIDMEMQSTLVLT